jgi:hypothetical protein
MPSARRRYGRALRSSSGRPLQASWVVQPPVARRDEKVPANLLRDQKDHRRRTRRSPPPGPAHRRPTQSGMEGLLALASEILHRMRLDAWMKVGIRMAGHACPRGGGAGHLGAGGRGAVARWNAPLGLLNGLAGGEAKDEGAWVAKCRRGRTVSDHPLKGGARATWARSVGRLGSRPRW